MTLNIATESKILVEGKVSDKFKVTKGFRQGDPLLTCLFKLVLEKVFRESGIKTNGIIYQQTCQFLAYADDIAVNTRTK